MPVPEKEIGGAGSREGPVPVAAGTGGAKDLLLGVMVWGKEFVRYIFWYVYKVYINIFVVNVYIWILFKFIEYIFITFISNYIYLQHYLFTNMYRYSIQIRPQLAPLPLLFVDPISVLV